MKHLNNFSKTKPSVRDLWETPKSFVDTVASIFSIRDFDLDPCCTKDNKKGLVYYDEEMDGLHSSWAICGYTTVFVNPPFSQMPLWIDKAIEESTANNMLVAFLHADSRDTSWYRQIDKYATHQLLPNRRLNYISPETGGKKSGVSFYSVVSVFTGLPKETLQQIRIII